MADISFDDLIPAQGQKAAVSPQISFDDLIPAKPQEQKGVMDYMAQGARALRTGLPFSDRITAGLGTLYNGKDYASNLAEERAKDAQLFQDNRVLANLGKGTGSLAIPMGSIAAIPQGASLGLKALVGAATGGTIGGVQGLSDAQDWTNIPDTAKHVAQGTLGGAVVGGSIPVFARGIGAAYSSVADALRGGASGVSGAAASHVLPAFTADGPQAVTGALQKLGPEGMLADAGPALLGKAQGASLNSEEGRSILANALSGRNKGANARIQGTVDDALGRAEDPVKATQNILDHRSQVDAKNYGDALAGAPPVDTGATLALIGQKLETAEGMQKKALLNLRDALLQQKETPLFNPDGSPVMTNGPSVRNAPRVDPMKGTKPRNLYDFIRDSGGVNDEHGELEALGLSRLINPNGRGYDEARRYAAEQGYLGANVDDAIANTYTGDFFNALQNGKNVFSAYDTDRVGLNRVRPPGPDPTNGWSPGPQIQAVEKKMVPKDRAENLHNIRQEIDNVVNYDAPGLGVPAGALQNQQGALKQVRGSLDENLKTQVPGFAQADAASSALARRADAVKLGTSLLDSGKTAITPENLAAQYQAMQPGERAALAKGLRGEIERQLDTKANDLVAGKNVIKGEGDWNRERLATVFGQEPTDRVIGLLDNEGKFRDTHNKVVENSQTAQRQAAASAMKPSPASETPLINPNMSISGAIGTIGKKAVSSLVNSMRGDPTAAYGEIARIMSAQGQQRDAYVSALVDALARRNQNAETGARVGDRAALAAALAANAYLQRPQQTR